MAKTSYAETRGSAGPAPALIRLANRIALLTFLAAFATVLGLALLPRLLADGPLPLRLLAAVPLLIAAGTVGYVRHLRRALRALRQGGTAP